MELSDSMCVSGFIAVPDKVIIVYNRACGNTEEGDDFL